MESESVADEAKGRYRKKLTDSAIIALQEGNRAGTDSLLYRTSDSNQSPNGTGVNFQSSWLRNEKEAHKQNSIVIGDKRQNHGPKEEGNTNSLDVNQKTQNNTSETGENLNNDDNQAKRLKFRDRSFTVPVPRIEINNMLKHDENESEGEQQNAEQNRPASTENYDSKETNALHLQEQGDLGDEDTNRKKKKRNLLKRISLKKVIPILSPRSNSSSSNLIADSEPINDRRSEWHSPSRDRPGSRAPMIGDRVHIGSSNNKKSNERSVAKTFYEKFSVLGGLVAVGGVIFLMMSLSIFGGDDNGSVVAAERHACNNTNSLLGIPRLLSEFLMIVVLCLCIWILFKEKRRSVQEQSYHERIDNLHEKVDLLIRKIELLGSDTY